MNDTQTPRRKRRYDEAFKRSAVEYWLVSGQSARRIAAELGINQQSLKIWKEKFKKLPGSQVAPTIDATYGSPRVWQWLVQRGHACGRHRVARLMRRHLLRSQIRRRFRVALTDSNHDLPIAPNRLRDLKVTQRDAVWVADITYVPTDEGWLYVAGVLDRHTRRCVGWAMGESLATSLPLAALEMAFQHRQPPRGLVHHSDRGVQYASETYRPRLAAAGVQPSMSRKGNCYDNALMENFWSSLKRELVHRAHFTTCAQARAAIFEWIEIFYNRERLHSALGYQSPVDFETQLN